ncbi:hypothetical protein [Flavobacterium sp. KBS0721]|uniref:hypothetical protein n=1 Tax=Flavobacterium sp. KBS0721 TaxID=1179672 RepID=UPI00098F25C3|nr:hypothetical protein [Flavobacterium sp. KBS0721]QDW21161.1 hypothetical protein B0M43_0013910 [Flavobacterium sp. KBS0721]
MRNSDDITDDEIRARTKKFNSLLQHPYTKVCKEMQSEIFRNPDFNEWKNNGKNLIYTLKVKYKKEFDDIDDNLVLFRMAKFPELLFEIENDEKLQEVEILKLEPDYNELIKGISYYSEEIYENDNAKTEIDNIVGQIINFINTNYPDLFS